MILTKDCIGKKFTCATWKNTAYFVPVDFKQSSVYGFHRNLTFKESESMWTSYDMFDNSWIPWQEEPVRVPLDEAINAFGCQADKVRNLVEVLKTMFAPKDNSK